jgi:hypothetical protein
MKRLNATIITIIIIIIGFFVFDKFGNKGLALFFGVLILLEISFMLLINSLREKFQWLITKKKDELPILSKEGLSKFIPQGYDSELGWIRKPNTSHSEEGKFGKTIWHTNEKGARSNPNHEEFKNIISVYGDSFSFSRQVNDNETWEWYLSDLTKSNVINFGVGNYGIDQALIRMKREYPKNKSPVVIMGVVPDTVSRIMSTWKHYYEYGNTFGFKPRFKIENGKLTHIKNYIDDHSKFKDYQQIIKELQKEDYFYKNKFKKDLIHFPYIISTFTNPIRNWHIISSLLLSSFYDKIGLNSDKISSLPMQKIMKINLDWRLKLYKKPEVVDLFAKIVEEFISYAKEQDFTPVLALLPQKDDVLYIKKKRKFYNHFIDKVKDNILTIDLINTLIKEQDLDKLYSDDNEYGGHYSKFGNELVAKVIYNRLRLDKII